MWPKVHLFNLMLQTTLKDGKCLGRKKEISCCLFRPLSATVPPSHLALVSRVLPGSNTLYLSLSLLSPRSCLLPLLGPAFQSYNIQLAGFGFHLWKHGALGAPHPHSHPVCSKWHQLTSWDQVPDTPPPLLSISFEGQPPTQCPRPGLHSSRCPQRSITRH